MLSLSSYKIEKYKEIGLCLKIDSYPNVPRTDCDWVNTHTSKYFLQISLELNMQFITTVKREVFLSPISLSPFLFLFQNKERFKVCSIRNIIKIHKLKDNNFWLNWIIKFTFDMVKLRTLKLISAHIVFGSKISQISRIHYFFKS